MAIPIERIKKYRRRFAWGFAGSVVLMLMVFLLFREAPANFQSSPTAEIPFLGTSAPALLSVGSLLIFFTTLIGLMITTLITWRKEHRESDHVNVDLQTNKLEREKLRREVAEKNAAATEKRNRKNKRRRRVD